MNLGETETEKEVLGKLPAAMAGFQLHIDCMKDHVEKGSYAGIVAHLATVVAGAMAIAEELVLEILTDDDMVKLIQQGIEESESAQFGRMLFLRGWWEMKREEDGYAESGQ